MRKKTKNMVLNITAEQLDDIKKAQEKFISETADTLKESIHASVNNHIQSLENVYNLAHKLGKKLNEETSTLINQYETERDSYKSQRDSCRSERDSYLAQCQALGGCS